MDFDRIVKLIITEYFSECGKGVLWDKFLSPDFLITELRSQAVSEGMIRGWGDDDDRVLEAIERELGMSHGDSEVIVVLDSSFLERKGLVFRKNRIREFCKWHWDTVPHSDLLSTFDHIFLIPAEGVLFVIHHEGLFCRFETKDY
ncbi:hypothetical protein FUAX_54040 (plasmid) [Fulvitalea axinellae]|uniref:CdiI n=1 Tax=Fulvitalea axinellae TaxID=1182444 RepID=A0AAU9CYY7_9BACT|nr:hypothetical protein FUAX_54040 [Fulvitalea axinellae]